MAKNQLKSEEKKLCAYLLPVFLPQNHKKKTPARILVQHLDARHQCLARSGLRMSVHRHRMRNHDQEWGDMVNDSTGLSRFKVKRNCHIFESSEAGSPREMVKGPRGHFFWGVNRMAPLLLQIQDKNLKFPGAGWSSIEARDTITRGSLNEARNILPGL